LDHHKDLGLGGVAARALYCTFVVFAAYNASGYSFYHWVTSPEVEKTSEYILQLLIGGALGFGFYNISDITKRTLQPIGVALVSVTIAAMAWYLVEERWVELRTVDDLVTAVQFTVVGVFTAGICYAHIHSRIGGLKQIKET